jgi:hypothetical protein
MVDWSERQVESFFLLHLIVPVWDFQHFFFVALAG